MRLLILNQFFHPDLSATAQIATDLAEDLVDLGVEVTALASRGTYLGGESLAPRERHRGIQIVRVAAGSFGKKTLLHRALDYLTFYLSATLALLRLRRHDVLLVLTTPPLIAAPALFAARWKKAKLVYWVQDLYPEVAIAFGALGPNSVLARIMRAVSRRVLSGADRVLALGEEMRLKCIAAGARSDRTLVVPNWADGTAVRPVPPEANALRPGLATGASLLVMYSGNMGRGHDLATILDAAALLENRRDVAFLFVGDGAKRAEVEAAARRLGNVRLAPYQPRDRLSESLSAGDAHLISLSPEVEGLVEPSKLYGILAAGRPALFVGPARSEVARTIEREECGIVVRNGDARGLADAILRLADDAEARGELGRRAREAFERKYDRKIATRRISEALAEA